LICNALRFVLTLFFLKKKNSNMFQYLCSITLRCKMGSFMSMQIKIVSQRDVVAGLIFLIIIYKFLFIYWDLYACLHVLFAAKEELFPVADATAFFTDLHHILRVIAAGNIRTLCHHRLNLLEQVDCFLLKTISD